MNENMIISKNYKLLSKLGEGGFGEVWKAINLSDNQEVAIKFENTKQLHQQLLFECKIYLFLSSDDSFTCQAIPKVYNFSKETDNNIMVMELLGSSILDLFNKLKYKFSIKTVLMLADQMIKRIEYIHSRGIVHRDIKPDNFSIGINRNAHRIFLLDFGVSRKYVDNLGDHISKKSNRTITGTIRYISLNVHKGVEYSRRDDLESLGYVLLFLVKGSLPWQNIQNENNNFEKHLEKIYFLKLKFIKKICKDLPKEFSIYLEYCRNWSFIDDPDYIYLRSLFKNLLFDLGYSYDYKFDWT